MSQENKCKFLGINIIHGDHPKDPFIRLYFHNPNTWLPDQITISFEALLQLEEKINDIKVLYYKEVYDKEDN
jgi:hypothetical protein